MRIGIDARMYGPEQGGLGRYIEQLIVNLEKVSSDIEFTIFLRRQNFNQYSPKNAKFSKVLADVPWYGWKEQFLMPRIIKKQKIDLMHFPHWNVPLFYGQPFIVTIHDLLLLHFPTRRASTLGPIFYWFKNLIFRKVLRHAINQARHIIVPSEYTKDDLINTLSVPKNKITVTYQAPSELPNTSPDADKKYLLNKPFVLYVGVAYPHKNLENLIKAWNIFKTKHATNVELILVGNKNYFYTQLTESSLYKNCPDVRFVGFVPDKYLPSLYQKSLLYIMPSLYEGYALPSLEALSYNLPVASSNATCLPEILGNAAVYFDPNSPENMAEIIYETLTDRLKREKLRENGQKILLRYSGQTLATETLTIYQKNGG